MKQLEQEYGRTQLVCEASGEELPTEGEHVPWQFQAQACARQNGCICAP